jgi:myosin V
LVPDPNHYYYLNRSDCVTVDDVDDQEDFIEVCKATEILGFTADEQHWLFSVVAAVLHLGNVQFELAPKYVHNLVPHSDRSISVSGCLL